MGMAHIASLLIEELYKIKLASHSIFLHYRIIRRLYCFLLLELARFSELCIMTLFFCRTCLFSGILFEVNQGPMAFFTWPEPYIENHHSLSHNLLTFYYSQVGYCSLK